jgi:hypothetical protein
VARVLLIAPTCDGTDVGEAWVSYQWAAGLAARHDVTLLTYHKRGRPTAAAQLTGLRVVEWTEPALLGRAERLNSLLKPGYVAFHARARRWIRSALAAGERFDVAHQPTPVAMRYPSPAAGLGIPLVLGPVGGGLDDPPAFATDGDTAPWYTRLRSLDGLRLRHDPLLRRTYSGASVVLGIAPYVRDNLRGVPVRRLEFLNDVAVATLPTPQVRTVHAGPLRLLFVGRVIRTKGVREAIRALAHLADLDVHLDVVGDGPDRPACEDLAASLGVADRVTFHGRRPHDEVDGFYRRADVFVFPSYREPGGTVVFEALGHGLPLIVCDRGGPSSVVDDQCGFRLAVSTPEALAADVAAAVRTLESDPDRRLAMGRAARDHVERTGTWQARLDAIERFYALAADDAAVPPRAAGAADRG